MPLGIIKIRYLDVLNQIYGIQGIDVFMYLCKNGNQCSKAVGNEIGLLRRVNGHFKNHIDPKD